MIISFNAQPYQREESLIVGIVVVGEIYNTTHVLFWCFIYPLEPSWKDYHKSTALSWLIFNDYTLTHSCWKPPWASCSMPEPRAQHSSGQEGELGENKVKCITGLCMGSTWFDISLVEQFLHFRRLFPTVLDKDPRDVWNTLQSLGRRRI